MFQCTVTELFLRASKNHQLGQSNSPQTPKVSVLFPHTTPVLLTRWSHPHWYSLDLSVSQSNTQAQEQTHLLSLLKFTAGPPGQEQWEEGRKDGEDSVGPTLTGVQG